MLIKQTAPFSSPSLSQLPHSRWLHRCGGFYLSNTNGGLPHRWARLDQTPRTVMWFLTPLPFLNSTAVLLKACCVSALLNSCLAVRLQLCCCCKEHLRVYFVFLKKIHSADFCCVSIIDEQAARQEKTYTRAREGEIPVTVDSTDLPSSHYVLFQQSFFFSRHFDV